MDPRFRYRRKKPSEQELRREENTERDREKRFRALSYAMVIPAYLVGGTLSGWFFGSWLDERNGTSFWLPLLVVLFTVAAFVMVIRLMTRLNS